jgi:hypothetical protein
MTYQNDPKLDRRQSYPMTEERSYAGWVVGGILALVVIAGLFFAFGRTDRNNTIANSPATTTGSAVPPASSTKPTEPTPSKTTAPR